ncbi:MAG: hypothetical protein ABF535_12080, partial [Acetobacter sp.]
MIKIALIYFGISRNPSQTRDGIYQNIIKPNEAVGVEFTYISFLNIIDRIHNPRSGEHDLNIERSDTLNLYSDYYFLFDQHKNNICSTLDVAKKRQDPFCDDWNSIRNLLNQLYVLKNGWNAFSALHNNDYDA